MANNSHKYYLEIDGERVIDFSRLKWFPDMSNFLTLSLFTGLFEGEDELLEALHNLKLIPSPTGNEDISVVKRMGNVKAGYNYKFVTSDILYKPATYVLSPSNIERFLNDNRSRYEAMKFLFERYSDDLDQLINYFEIKIQRLESMLSAADAKEKKDIREELDSKSNSLRNFQFYKSNIITLLAVINYMSNPSYHFERDMELDFISRVRIFVESEVHYIRGKRKTPNYRGLVKLALRIKELLNEFPDLRFPYDSTNFYKERAQLLKFYKAVLLEIAKGNSPFIESESLKGNGEKKVSSDDESDVPEIDPDRFMFLEVEDFEKLLAPDDGEDLKMSVELDIANLEAQQGKFGKL